MSITNEELTSGKLEGAGTFDLLMSTMNAHLAAQFNKGHLTGPQYSEVYLGGMSTAMSQAIEFLLRRETTNKQNELLDEQIVQAALQTTQLGLQNEQIQAQTDQINTQRDLTLKQIDLATKELVLADKNIEKTTQEVLLLQQQVEINDLTMDKARAEIALLAQKLITEQAQTQDEVGALKITGIIGKQASLYQAQTKGFAHDNKQKVAKIFSDIYSVARGTDNGVPLPYTQQSGSNIVNLNTELEEVLDKLKSSMET